MNGVDAIAFTAGIGENAPGVRAQVMKQLKYMGVEIDPVNDSIHGDECMISTKDSKVKVFVVPTNEEMAICRDTVEIVTEQIVKEAIDTVMGK